jgi:hypothetical protein
MILQNRRNGEGTGKTGAQIFSDAGLLYLGGISTSLTNIT